MVPEGGTERAFQDDLSVSLLCPDCREDPPNLVEEFSSGDVVCTSCGRVVGSRVIDTRSEWRTFANDDQNGDDPNRVGGPRDEFVDDEQLATTVSFSETKAHKILSRTQNTTTQSRQQKGLLQGYKEIVSFCDAINVGQNITNAAKHIYKLVDKHRSLRGKPQEAIVAGSIFIACRQNNTPRSFREICKLTNVGLKEMGKIFKLLQNILQQTQEASEVGATGLNTVANYENVTVSAEDMCSRFVSQLGFKAQQKISKMSREIAEMDITRSVLSGRSPLSIAGACIYIACHLVGEKRTSAEIAQQAGCSDGTVRTAYKLLHGARDELLQQAWKDEGMTIDDLPKVQIVKK